MLTKTKYFLSVLLLTALSSFSQKYFQQEVNYKINVRLDDESHELFADESIEYINNSNDELSFIYFHIWPNAYKNNTTALAKQVLKYSRSQLFNIEERRGYIDSLDFKVNGKKVIWEFDKEHIDICKIYLNNPLKSGEKIIISTPFHVKIPKGNTSRLGHIKQSYQITQWYPKPAVYDQYGWHQMPYLNQGEFYSEFGSFDVSITLPKNYIVGATGDLQNKEEINWLNKLADETLKIKSFDKTDASFPKSSKEYKTIRYTQNKVHDFAWFTDKRFHVLKGEVTLPVSKRKVTTWAMFPNNEADLWKNALEYINDAVYFYSDKYGDYPYQQCTALHSALSAGSGMEYPNVTIIGNSTNKMRLEVVIMHEVGHNWFYGILGSNERMYTWMDEGLNSFSEALYLREKYGKEDAVYKMAGMKEKWGKLLGIEFIRYKYFQELTYILMARSNKDQQASLNADQYIGMNYGAITYMKTARVFEHLRAYIGVEKFDNIMHQYFENWKFKHPYPIDLQNLFEKETGKNLSWLFDDLLKTTKKIDYKICKVKENQITIKNKGDISSPLVINGIKNNQIVFSEWFEGFKGKKQFKLSTNQKVDKIVIDAQENTIDLYRKNNTYKTSGIFRKMEPINIRLLNLIEKPNKTQIGILPVLGWNNHNKMMLGAHIYNPIIPQNKIEYELMPLYSFGTKDLAGMAKIKYNWYPTQSAFQHITFSLSGQQYAYKSVQGKNFQTGEVGLSLLLKNKELSSHVKNRVSFKAITASNLEDLLADAAVEHKQYFQFNLSHANYTKSHYLSIASNNQFSDNFGKTSLAARYAFRHIDNKRMLFKLYAGTFIYKADDLSNIYQFNVSGKNGNNDYLFQDTYLSRFNSSIYNNFINSQFSTDESGFVSHTNFGNTDLLVSLNATTAIPYISSRKFPIEIFANMAYFSEDDLVPDLYKLNNFAWESGVKLSLLNKSVNIYLPVLMSEGLKNSTDSMTDKYLQRIRFTTNLNNINPFKIIKKQLF